MNIAKFIFRILFGRRFPVTGGTLEVRGIERPVLIRRDGYGVAYITAQNEHDAWFGLGFCHGQDRAFQLELLLRVVRGTLSEIMGPSTLAIDRLSRRIGFARAAAGQWRLLDGVSRDVIKAYISGINRGNTAGCKRIAHEFSLLTTRPSRFDGSDVLGVLGLLSFTLASNWDVELSRLKILSLDGASALKALDPAFEKGSVTRGHSPSGKADHSASLDALARDLEVFTDLTGMGGGSNNWVLSQDNTATGRPILANDPHLVPRLPPYWYLANLHAPALHVAGASFVGAPCFPAGHNQKAGWGMTAALTDNTDLFLEYIGEDGQSVRNGNGYITCPVRSETILVKGKKPVVERVLVTPRGPVIGPAIGGDFGAISMSAVWLEQRRVRGLLYIHRANSFEEFRRAFRQWPALSLNMVYADIKGSIGWQLAGQVPRRKKGYGTIPLPGYENGVGWYRDTVPFSRMPFLLNPPEGFIVTANNQPRTVDRTTFLGVDWLDEYRKNRITQALEARRDWDLRSTQALQSDETSLPWSEIRETVLGLKPKSREARLALELLRTWDGVVSGDSAAAAVYELFMVEMIRRIVLARAPKSAVWALGRGFTSLNPRCFLALRRFGHLVRLLLTRPETWFPGSWEEEMEQVLEIVIKNLRARFGPNTGKWAWGGIRTLVIPHDLGRKKPLALIFNRGPFACGGDATTVSQAAVDLIRPANNPLVTASLRMVLDIGNWNENSFALPGGQSGNPLSAHYADFIPLWRANSGIAIAWSEDKITQKVRDKLDLLPAGTG